MDFIDTWIVPPDTRCGATGYIVTALVAFLLTAVSKGGFGGGVGIVSVPLMLQVAPPTFVLGMWLPVLIACDSCTIRQYPKEWNPRAFLKLLPGMLLGIIIATLAFGGGKPSAENQKNIEAVLKIAVAIISVAFVTIQMRPAPKLTEQPWTPSWGVSLPVGIVSGVTTMIAHAAGPIVNMFFLAQKMEKRVFVGTCGRFFFLANSIKIPFTIAAGWLTLSAFKYSVWLILLAPLGVGLGAWLNRRISPLWFVRLVYVSLIFAAAKLGFDVWKMM